MFDLVIENGTIIDGTGAPGTRADLGIRGELISAVGDLGRADAGARIDAAEKVVAPGFIDVHTHSDGWLLRSSHFTPKTLQGVTTELLMLDGIGYAPVNRETAREWLFYLRALDGLRMDDYSGWESLGEFMRCIEGGTVQNAAAHVPYANVRSMACGFGREAVDDFRMRQIRRDVARSMDEGAIGLSTGLDYIVQCFATTDELVEACSVVAEYGGLYATHVRYKAGLLRALQEAVEIGRRAGVPVHISHLKAPSGEQADKVLEYIDTVARHEVEFSFDVYPYQPGSTMLSYLLPYDVWEDGPVAAAGKLRDPRIRGLFREGLDAYRLDPDSLFIAWTLGRDGKRHQGKLLSEYVAETGLSTEEALTEMLIEERMAVLMVINEGDDTLIDPFLSHELSVIGSDGIYQEDGRVHPRVFGTAGRVLGTCVRDRRLFSLEEAVHKLSGRPAERFGLRNRGVLKEGNYADVVVFDPQTIADRATYDDPQQHTTGVEHVVVNGTPVVAHGVAVESLSEPLPGRYVGR